MSISARHFILLLMTLSVECYLIAFALLFFVVPMNEKNIRSDSEMESPTCTYNLENCGSCYTKILNTLSLKKIFHLLVLLC
jgi:hypothetical protein